MSDFSSSYPNSRKIFVDGPRGFRVPVREIALEQGASSLRVYDTSGPEDHDVKHGLPKLREPWVAARKGDACVTQLHYARAGEITPEMNSSRSARAFRPTSCATRSHAAARSSRPTSDISSSSR